MEMSNEDEKLSEFVFWLPCTNRQKEKLNKALDILNRVKREGVKKVKRKRNENLLLNDRMGEGRCKEERLETIVLRKVLGLETGQKGGNKCAPFGQQGAGSIIETACGDIWIGGIHS